MADGLRRHPRDGAVVRCLRRRDRPTGPRTAPAPPGTSRAARPRQHPHHPRRMRQAPGSGRRRPDRPVGLVTRAPLRRTRPASTSSLASGAGPGEAGVDQPLVQPLPLAACRSRSSVGARGAAPPRLSPCLLASSSALSASSLAKGELGSGALSRAGGPVQTGPVATSPPFAPAGHRGGRDRAAAAVPPLRAVAAIAADRRPRPIAARPSPRRSPPSPRRGRSLALARAVASAGHGGLAPRPWSPGLRAAPPAWRAPAAAARRRRRCRRCRGRVGRPHRAGRGAPRRTASRLPLAALVPVLAATPRSCGDLGRGSAALGRAPPSASPSAATGVRRHGLVRAGAALGLSSGRCRIVRRLGRRVVRLRRRAGSLVGRLRLGRRDVPRHGVRLAAAGGTASAAAKSAARRLGRRRSAPRRSLGRHRPVRLGGSGLGRRHGVGAGAAGAPAADGSAGPGRWSMHIAERAQDRGEVLARAAAQRGHRRRSPTKPSPSAAPAGGSPRRRAGAIVDGRPDQVRQALEDVDAHGALAAHAEAGGAVEALGDLLVDGDRGAARRRRGAGCRRAPSPPGRHA